MVDFLVSGVPTEVYWTLLGVTVDKVADKVLHPKQFLDDLKRDDRLRLAEKLRRRNFTGERLLRVFTKYEEWDPKQLERLYEFTENEALRVLINAGYEPGEGGFWKKSRSVAGDAQRQAMEKIRTDAGTTSISSPVCVSRSGQGADSPYESIESKTGGSIPAPAPPRYIRRSEQAASVTVCRQSCDFMPGRTARLDSISTTERYLRFTRRRSTVPRLQR